MIAPLPGGGHLAYDDRGAGDVPVLLLRPLGGSHVLWGRFADALAVARRVIAFDHRGSGRSSAAPLGTTTRTLAQDARALLDHLGVARADVFGSSLGGMAATWLAADAPARVRRLVLASTLPRGRAAGLAHSLRRARAGVGLAACFARSGPAAARCLARRILSPQFRAREPAEARRIADAMAAEPVSRRGLLALAAAAARHDASNVLPTIAAPTLLLCGGLDPIVTAAAERELVTRLVDASLHVIPRSGHALTFEAPAETAAAVLAFLGTA